MFRHYTIVIRYRYQKYKRDTLFMCKNFIFVCVIFFIIVHDNGLMKKPKHVALLYSEGYCLKYSWD